MKNKKQPPATVVIGNSITHFWGGLPKGPVAQNDKAWSDTFGKNALNMGYGWDRIENVLWRVYHGELDGFKAKQIFVNIGTNWLIDSHFLIPLASYPNLLDSIFLQ